VITVRDKTNTSCQFVLSGVALTDPAPLTASAQPVNPTCAGNDGTITVTATGGAGTYNYSITNGNGLTATNATGVFPGLPAGSYTVTVGDTKCSTTLAR
jgi:hypothetical protein